MSGPRMIYANQVRSLFLEGLDTHEIARRFEISEGEAYNLLDEARKERFRVNHTSASSRKRGQIRGTLVSGIARRQVPVTLAAVSFLRELR